jgi:hypothetical protein
MESSKRLALEAYSRPRRNGILAISVDDDDCLLKREFDSYLPTETAGRSGSTKVTLVKWAEILPAYAE